MRMLLPITLVLMCGCANSIPTHARLGVLNRDPVTTATAGVHQASGRHAVNVSPSLAVSGGGGLLFLMALVATWNWMRTRRTLKAVVGAVEQLEDPFARKVKRGVAREALAAGIADTLHAAVRRWGNTSLDARRRRRGHRTRGVRQKP